MVKHGEACVVFFNLCWRKITSAGQAGLEFASLAKLLGTCPSPNLRGASIKLRKPLESLPLVRVQQRKPLD